MAMLTVQSLPLWTHILATPLALLLDHTLILLVTLLPLSIQISMNPFTYISLTIFNHPTNDSLIALNACKI